MELDQNQLKRLRELYRAQNPDCSFDHYIFEFKKKLIELNKSFEELITNFRLSDKRSAECLQDTDAVSLLEFLLKDKEREVLTQSILREFAAWLTCRQLTPINTTCRDVMNHLRTALGIKNIREGTASDEVLSTRQLDIMRYIAMAGLLNDIPYLKLSFFIHLFDSMKKQ